MADQEGIADMKADQTVSTAPISKLAQFSSAESDHAATESETPSHAKDGFGMWKHPHYDNGGRVEAAALGAFAMYIYYKTLPPSITGGDSGEV
jgi:hypothetical protein